MKKLFLFLFLLLLLPIQTFASDFSNLNALCTWKLDGEYISNSDKLILPHINEKITKSEGYVKSNDYLYMVANTFTDNYRFLGSYLLSYDCKSKTTTRLSPVLKKNISGELGFIRFSETAHAIMVINMGTTSNAVWIYDLELGALKTINNRLIKIPKGYKISWTVDLDSYDGKSVNLEVLYYTGNYKYINYGNPEIITYIF